MFDLATATLATFEPHVGTAFRLDHPEQEEVFTLAHAEVHRGETPEGVRDGFTLLFDGKRTDVQFDQQILPLEHAAIGKLQLFLVPIARNADGTVRYQAIFS